MGFMGSSSLSFIKKSEDRDLLTMEMTTLRRKHLIYYSQVEMDELVKEILEILKFSTSADYSLLLLKIFKFYFNVELKEYKDVISFLLEINQQRYSKKLKNIIVILFNLIVNYRKFKLNDSFKSFLRTSLGILFFINQCDKRIIFNWMKYFYIYEHITLLDIIYDNLINDFMINEIITNIDELYKITEAAISIADNSMIEFLKVNFE